MLGAVERRTSDLGHAGIELGKDVAFTPGVHGVDAGGDDPGDVCRGRGDHCQRLLVRYVGDAAPGVDAGDEAALRAPYRPEARDDALVTVERFAADRREHHVRGLRVDDRAIGPARVPTDDEAIHRVSAAVDGATYVHFDQVINLHFLYAHPTPERVLQEAYRVLKPGGRVVCLDTTPPPRMPMLPSTTCP